MGRYDTLITVYKLHNTGITRRDISHGSPGFESRRLLSWLKYFFLDFFRTTGREMVCYVPSDVTLSVSHLLHDHPIIHKVLYKPRKEYYVMEVT